MGLFIRIYLLAQPMAVVVGCLIAISLPIACQALRTLFLNGNPSLSPAAIDCLKAANKNRGDVASGAKEPRG